ncbi:MAG: ABC-F family ATP-binding cassette domain-containing protein [Lachnospiraceae bacterium]|nr:ABC-F family ATP-binding cassette domain-containing protein [Lachnospiraceae bacterium]
MNLLNLEHVYKSFENRELLHDATVGIDDTDRIGVIGVNGTGKSTMLSIIAGTLEPDDGKVIRGGSLRIAYLLQNPDFDNEKSIIENVVAKISGKAEHWDVTGEAKSMLLRFGIDNPDSKPDILSGGQKKRAALVATLLTPADLLILDEPTNHLDHAMIEYLQEYLNNYSGALLLVTHDRYFLDQVTNRILEIDKAGVYKYETNYSGYLELREQRLDYARAAERKMATLYRKDLAWIQRGARARSTKQKAHIQRFEALRDREKIIEDRNVEMQSLASRLGGKTIECNGLSKRYGERVLFQDFTYIFGKVDRVGIIGPNGCGKSTLLKTIIGQIAPDTGTVEIGQTVKIGYFGQENEELRSDGRVIDIVKDKGEYVETKDGKVTASKMCETFLFDGNMQYTPVSKLSGGEKRRLYLLQVLMTSPNVLILDEPTNDLDIQTLRVLEDYLDTFQGIVITVSHDRYFLDRVVTRIFSFEPGGIIARSEGGYEDYYLRGFASTEEAKVGVKVTASSDGKKDSSSKEDWKKPREQKKLSYKDQKEYDTIEEDIDKIEKRIHEIDDEMVASATDYPKLATLSAEKQELEEQLDYKMLRFMELQDLVDSFN